jgi:beta-aspartyl-peptidase (threonine type)
MAAETGYRILIQTGSSLNAVEEAVAQMEDNPLFNAGTGSALNLLGEVEDDAAIMEGHTLRGGAVALLKGIKNPVRAARLVMNETDHVLIAGPSARSFALKNGLLGGKLKTRNRVKSWQLAMRLLREKRTKQWSKKHRDTAHGMLLSHTADTVGALAVDSYGRLAAADSTGGMQLKLPGRIGDSPLLGAGIYADANGAAAATGIGEQAILLAISKTACIIMKNREAEKAAEYVVRLSTRQFGPGTGIITLSKNGSYGVAHNTPNLCWCAKSPIRSRSGMSALRIPIK